MVKKKKFTKKEAFKLLESNKYTKFTTEKKIEIAKNINSKKFWEKMVKTINFSKIPRKELRRLIAKAKNETFFQAALSHGKIKPGRKLKFILSTKKKMIH